MVLLTYKRKTKWDRIPPVTKNGVPLGRHLWESSENVKNEN